MTLCSRCHEGTFLEFHLIGDELLCDDRAYQAEKGMWNELQYGLEEAFGPIAARRLTVLA